VQQVKLEIYGKKNLKIQLPVDKPRAVLTPQGPPLDSPNRKEFIISRDGVRLNEINSRIIKGRSFKINSG
jgi:hypothetical protein